ncbi:hypothetical protein NY547_01080 [Cnuibacter physcomitrellae]|uniref:hypothetical protein n=1 Tax=Cnuibacter physcomitrellae TaxID=1619308 RepID=UPI002175B053|nr:hypothetical protein [Cnuibacter physcomitrellae]MCS5495832.1 hypothetical protein [Cnuibacter physcomitrellae]
MSSERIEHRRGADGEILGWIEPRDEGFVAIDLLGRERTGVVDWLTAEEALEAVGLSYLADPHELLLETGEWLRVRIAEVGPNEIRVKKDDWGAVGAPQVYFTLPMPVSEDRLRSLRR